jgi:hypothetical protein
MKDTMIWNKDKTRLVRWSRIKELQLKQTIGNGEWGIYAYMGKDGYITIEIGYKTQEQARAALASLYVQYGRK